MPRLSSTLRLAADPEDAMDEESGLRLGLVYSARARVLARHLGVLTFEAGVRAQKRTTIDGESWKGKARRREKTSRGGWLIPIPEGDCAEENNGVGGCNLFSQFDDVFKTV